MHIHDEFHCQDEPYYREVHLKEIELSSLLAKYKTLPKLVGIPMTSLHSTASLSIPF